MDEKEGIANAKAASLRWGILRQALRRRSPARNSGSYNFDNTGLICQWPSEEVLAYFCLSHADMSKRVIELGSGYGLAGLVIAATTEALEHNIDANSGAFGGTKVRTMALHWNQEEASSISNSFDIIVASDCPKRGDSLDKFLQEIEENGLHYCLTENYDTEVWMRHQGP
uniref:Calmodulin-lysine N-methyltransferase n=1 Tax=Manihot esculenta TaxID=3983 RepID=A0A2C9WKT1_MANES